MSNIVTLQKERIASHYAPLPVVLTRGRGVYLWDENGRQYFDAMAGYSAVNHGHVHPRIVCAVMDQITSLAVQSNAFHNNRAAPLAEKLLELSGHDKAIFMNTGAEGVETAIKLARKWGYRKKKIPINQAQIIVCEGNFHGRTSTIISFSSERQFSEYFGPLTPGFVTVPFGDADALESAITNQTAAFLFEPIQGEGGIRIPPDGYLKKCQEICSKKNVLMIADEIQTGLGRTGHMFACDHEDVKPDLLILGKSLGGGSGIPVSTVLGRKDVMDVFDPGDHGSTFGGSPLACAVASTSLDVIREENFVQNSSECGKFFLDELRKINSPIIREVRGRGLFIGIEIDLDMITADEVCARLLHYGVISKDAHGVIRITPPLVVTKEQIIEVLPKIRTALS